MERNEYPKLVRDNIPDIIKEKEGFEPTYRILEDDAEFLSALLKKITEEAAELERSVESKNTEEELADLLELIETTTAFLGKTSEDIKNIQQEKREHRGGFQKRILMDEPRKPQS
ncbi:MAG TPA: nucleoside triphosphate pyrophosphohydrolase [Candidatus Paceibacterota bacterium]|nr:nucleoside triphosphate pyrophosphohydrolase [Candidatus Paceibacterota bacterium]